MTTTAQVNSNKLSIERVFDASIALVWQAWTEPDLIKQWWGPIGFTSTIHKMEIKDGGEWNLTMHGPDGTDYRNESVFLEMRKHEKIVYDHLTGPRFVTTVLFEDLGTQTKILMSMEFPSAEQLQQAIKTFGADKGLDDTMDRLKQFLQNNL